MKPKAVIPKDSPAPVGPYSPAVRYGELLFLSGQIPLGKDGNLVPGGIKEQTRQVLENISGILADQGADFTDVIKTTVFMVDLGEFGAMNDVYGEYFHGHKPARSTIQVGGLPRNARVEIEVIAGNRGETA